LWWGIGNAGNLVTWVQPLTAVAASDSKLGMPARLLTAQTGQLLLSTPNSRHDPCTPSLTVSGPLRLTVLHYVLLLLLLLLLLLQLDEDGEGCTQADSRL
jgi:hypothetical protein